MSSNGDLESVQTVEYEPISPLPVPDHGSSEIVRSCPCGCGLLPAEGRRWATDGCRKRYWLIAHPSLNLDGLTVEQAVAANRMAQEAVRAARLGQARATVDTRLPVKHKAEVRPDPRPSCRPRLNPDRWVDLELLRDMLKLPTRTAVVKHLIEAELERFLGVKEEAGDATAQDC